MAQHQADDETGPKVPGRKVRVQAPQLSRTGGMDAERRQGLCRHRPKRARSGGHSWTAGVGADPGIRLAGGSAALQARTVAKTAAITAINDHPHSSRFSPYVNCAPMVRTRPSNLRSASRWLSPMAFGPS